jgi:hypothetical protein
MMEPEDDSKSDSVPVSIISRQSISQVDLCREKV